MPCVQLDTAKVKNKDKRFLQLADKITKFSFKWKSVSSDYIFSKSISQIRDINMSTKIGRFVFPIQDSCLCVVRGSRQIAGKHLHKPNQSQDLKLKRRICNCIHTRVWVSICCVCVCVTWSQKWFPSENENENP